MKIKNVSGKILGIGLSMTVLPGETKELPAEYENHPVIHRYAKKGIVKLIKSPVPAQQEKEEDSGETKELPAEYEDLSGMTAEELSEYAKSNGIDIGRSTSVEGILKKILEAGKE